MEADSRDLKVLIEACRRSFEEMADAFDRMIQGREKEQGHVGVCIRVAANVDGRATIIFEETTPALAKTPYENWKYDFDLIARHKALASLEYAASTRGIRNLGIVDRRAEYAGGIYYLIELPGQVEGIGVGFSGASEDFDELLNERMFLVSVEDYLVREANKPGTLVPVTS